MATTIRESGKLTQLLKTTILMKKINEHHWTSINVLFSIAMLVYQRVVGISWCCSFGPQSCNDKHDSQWLDPTIPAEPAIKRGGLPSEFLNAGLTVSIIVFLLGPATPGAEGEGHSSHGACAPGPLRLCRSTMRKWGRARRAPSSFWVSIQLTMIQMNGARG